MRLAAPATIAVVIAANAVIASAQDKENRLDPEPVPGQRTIAWADFEGEAIYHVSGTVSYLPEASCGPAPLIKGESIEFSEDLPADSTTYEPPEPSDPRLTWRKEMQFTIEALDSGGAVLDMNGFAFTADKFCSPEEIAATGTGFTPAGSADLRVPATALAALGGLCLATGALIRRRAA